MLGNYVGIRDKHLNAYYYSSGGGMTGGYRNISVIRWEGQALVSFESAEWFSEDPTVNEYLADIAVLEEIEAIVRKYKMNHWNKRKFTELFVHDGESHSYRFVFDDADIYFSSQIYPETYGSKLAELSSVIEKYVREGEKLPGLVNQKIDDDTQYSLPEGKAVIYVCSYAENTLGLRILNGTDEEIKLSETYKIINHNTGALLIEENTPYGGEIGKHSKDEIYIRLKERLTAGNYIMILGDWEIPFEIR